MWFTLCLLIISTIGPVAVAQESASLDSNISDILVRMRNQKLAIREAAFEEVMSLISDEQQTIGLSRETALTTFFRRHPDKAEPVKLGLIQLLSTEDDVFVQGKPGTLTEEDGEYYAEVIDVVSSLNDERSIRPLVGAMTTGGMAQRGLVKYGDKALGPVMAELKNPNALVRAVALGMSVTLLDARNNSNSHARALELIRSSLSDPEPVVRSHAVREIACLNERQEFVATLEKIAQTDPKKSPGKAVDGGDGEEYYPVRYDARRTLHDIQDNKECVAH